MRRVDGLILVLVLAACSSDAQGARKSSAPSPLARVVTIGASVTAGAANGLPLAKVFNFAITAPHQPVQQRTTFFFPLDLEGNAERVMDETLELRPTLVIGADFLFWFAYGRCPPKVDEAKWRIERLDIGLTQVARLECPVVIGDIPDMSGANKLVLAPVVIPSAEARAVLNRHLAEWAGKRPNVIVAPVSAWVKRLRAGRWTIPASKDGRYKDTQLSVKRAMAGDGLHLSAAGSIVLAGRVIDLVRKRLGDRADAFILDPWKAAETFGVVPKPGRRSL